MSVELVHHPLLSHTAMDRETYQKSYVMSGLQELQTIAVTDSSISAAASTPSQAYFNLKPSYGSLVDRNILLELTVKVVTSANSFGDYFASIFVNVLNNYLHTE